MNESKIKFALGKNGTKISFDTEETTRALENEIKIGIGEKKIVEKIQFYRLIRLCVRKALHFKRVEICFDFAELKKLSENCDINSDEEYAKIIAQEVIVANYEFRKYKTEPKKGWINIKSVSLENLPKGNSLEENFYDGILVGEEINSARALANISGSDMTPEVLAEAARQQKKLKNIKVKIIEAEELLKLGMNAIIGVGKSAEISPKLIIVEYNGGSKEDNPVVIVGKGITFDSGGLSIKGGDHMLGMHMDMTGGAIALHTVILAAKMKMRKNVIAIIPAAENAISDQSMRPGDILRAFNGKTIEVKNTDAEGRLILADAISYAEKIYSPKIIIDVATLTGAALVAVGQNSTVAISRDNKLSFEICKVSEKSGERIWSLPMWSDYESDLKSKRADISNIAPHRYGGTINGAVFISQFVSEKTPWVHLDIAPRMESVEIDNLTDGATGEPIRTLIEFVRTVN